MSALGDVLRKHAEAIGSGRQQFIHGTPYFAACRVLEEDEGEPGLVFERDTDEDSPHTRMVTLAFVLAKMEFEERKD